MPAAPVPPTDKAPSRALRSRLLTAAVLGGALVLCILFATPGTLAGVLAIFLGLAALEWASLCGWPRLGSLSFVVLTLALATGLWAAAQSAALQQVVLVPTVAGWIAAGVAVVRAERGHAALPRAAWQLALLGIWVLVPLWLGLLWLHAADPALLLALLGLIWIADSAAYFAGRRYGKRRLAPLVSPGKTWAGCWAALLSALLVGVAFGLGEGYRGATLAGFGMLCLVTVIASIVGDLFESLLKRRAGVKDSGKLLPGHGGVLDRVDSLTAAAPIFYWGLSLLGPRT